ncbi:MAG: rhomboid family intramembrane serine protease [Actinobacteria bacterium]|nr:rhomboid family intramembrane serine protease [Actinomycetota bacterium]
MEARAGPMTCYRHPDRETRLSCSSCGRPVCVECVRAAAVGQRCPDCAAPQGRARVITAADIRGGGVSRAPVSTVLIGMSVGVFALTLVAPDLGRQLYAYGAQANGAVEAGQWWRLLTAAFLHQGLLHIGFNMWALYIFGPALEERVGSWAFTALYLSSAVAGGALFFLLGTGVAVGASGAIFGLFGAWLAIFTRSRNTVAGRAVFQQLVTLLAINLALPLVVPNIAWQAHLGGLVTGFAVSGVWLAASLRGPRRTPARALVAVLPGLLALGLVLGAGA